jgi:hypothetical protein
VRGVGYVAGRIKALVLRNPVPAFGSTLLLHCCLEMLTIYTVVLVALAACGSLGLVVWSLHQTRLLAPCVAAFEDRQTISLVMILFGLLLCGFAAVFMLIFSVLDVGNGIQARPPPSRPSAAGPRYGADRWRRRPGDVQLHRAAGDRPDDAAAAPGLLRAGRPAIIPSPSQAHGMASHAMPSHVSSSRLTSPVPSRPLPLRHAASDPDRIRVAQGGELAQTGMASLEEAYGAEEWWFVVDNFWREVRALVAEAEKYEAELQGAEPGGAAGAEAEAGGDPGKGLLRSAISDRPRPPGAVTRPSRFP